MDSIKVVRCELTLKHRVKGEEHTSKYSAEIHLCADSDVGDIADFTDGMHKIWNKAVATRREYDRALPPEGNYPDFKMEVVEHVMDRGDSYSTASYHRWYTYEITDVCAEKGAEGIYLRPDTKYNGESSDMLIGKNILRDMAYYM